MSESTKLTDILGSSELQTLLTTFNDLDADKQGTITIQQAKDQFLLMQLPSWSDDILSRCLITTQQITFDEFLAVLWETEVENTWEHAGKRNNRLFQFLRMLEDYRMKCEMQGQYEEAERSYKKSEEIRQKQVMRQERVSKQQHRLRVNYIQTLERDKVVQFRTAWSDYNRQFEITSEQIIQNLKSKHLLEMERLQQKLMRQCSLKPRPTKAFRQLKQQQKLLANMKDYQQAQKIKALCRKLQKQQHSQRQQWMENHITQRTENLRKKQQNILMAHLKKIQTTRDLQMKKQKQDEQRLIFKLGKLRHDIQQKQASENKNRIQKLRESMSMNIYRRKKINSLPKIYAKQGDIPNPQGQTRMFRGGKQPFKIRINSFNRPRIENNNSTTLDDDI